MIYIHNMTNGLLKQPNAFKVDRSSPLGNPYRTPPYSREHACFHYELYLPLLLSQDSRERIYFEKLVEVARKGDLFLMCWCFPLQCHADFIKKLIEERLNDTRT